MSMNAQMRNTFYIILAVTVAGFTASTPYPLAIRLIAPRRTAAGGFEFALTGPPGLYRVLGSTDLALWTELDLVTNTLGTARFNDAGANSSPQKFYRVRSP